MGSTSPLTNGKRGRERERATFFGSISTICFAAGDGAKRCRGNWSKKPNLAKKIVIWARTITCCHLQHDLKTKLHSILLVPVDDGLVT